VAEAFFLEISLASAITTSITVPLYTEVNDLSRLMAKQSSEIASVSDGLDTLTHIIVAMHTEMLLINKHVQQLDKNTRDMGNHV
jgi:hypothetical protein